MALDILIVDDERDIRDLVAGVLSDEGYDCRTAGDSQAALDAVDAQRPSLVLLDVWLHGSPMDGLEVLDAIKAREPDLPVIVFSGHGNIDTAVAAIGHGAVDFIEKPFEAEKLLHLVSRATETERLRRENAQLRQGFATADEFTGNSPVINQVRATLEARRQYRQPPADLRPGGGGQGSRRPPAAQLEQPRRQRLRQRQFRADHARTLRGRTVRPGSGRQSGAPRPAGDCRWRHALSRRSGRHAASTQARILRVLTDQAFVRVGGNRQIRVDVRVVSSTSRNLEEEIAAGRFREDLFYRLNVVPIAVPSLAERRDDIPALADHFFARYAREQGIPPPEVGLEAMAALQAYEWPGNVRQLRNVIERTIILAPRERLAQIEADMLPPEILSERMRKRFAAVGADGRAAARGARELRAGISQGPDQALFRQYFQDRRLHRHGTLGAAPQAQAAGHGRTARGRGRRGISTVSDVSHLPVSHLPVIMHPSTG